MAALPAPEFNPVTTRGRKKLVRLSRPDRSQTIRLAVQCVFVAINIWIGWAFYTWARYFERGGIGLYVERPAGVEGWLPIAGLMNTRYLLQTGRVPDVHPAAMYLFLGFLLMSLLLRRAFCSWLCPVGTLSEILWKLGRKIFRGNIRVVRWLDLPLRALKYLLLVFFAALIGVMSAEALAQFMHTPYGLVVDVRMMNFFRDMSWTALLILAALAVLSMLIRNFWCRYLCPYGALLGLASLLSPVKIRRDEQACIDCGKCARACPSNLAVDKLVQIRSAECTACMECMASCPAQGALQLALPPRQTATSETRWYRRRIGPFAVAATLAYIFLGVVLLARATNHWNSEIPAAVYQELVPRANSLSHPGY